MLIGAYLRNRALRGRAGVGGQRVPKVERERDNVCKCKNESFNANLVWKCI